MIHVYKRSKFLVNKVEKFPLKLNVLFIILETLVKMLAKNNQNQIFDKKTLDFKSKSEEQNKTKNK